MLERLSLDKQDDKIGKMLSDNQMKRLTSKCPQTSKRQRTKIWRTGGREWDFLENVCTQSLKTINRFHEKYRIIPSYDEDVQKHDSEFQKELDQCIACWQRWGLGVGFHSETQGSYCNMGRMTWRSWQHKKYQRFEGEARYLYKAIDEGVHVHKAFLW